MFPGMNQRKMQQMMRQMGVSQVEIPALQVIIRTAEKDLIIDDPQVAQVNMMGQVSLQVSGTIREQAHETKGVEISQEDIETVAMQADVSEDDARSALQETKGDLAQAILILKKKES